MKDFKVLHIVDKFQGIFKAMHVDYPMMRHILAMKLTMDERRVPTIMGQNNTNNRNKKNGGEKKEKNSFISSLWVYMLMGALIIPLMFISQSYIFTMSLVFGVVMFMIMTSLISDFSSVLLDVRDKNILMTKPVNSRTVNMAKAVHIFIYMFYLTISMAAGTLVTSLIRYGILFFLLYLVELVLMDLFIIAATAILYTIILKYTDGERLKDIINYVQIGLSLTITIGYQLVARMFDFVDYNIVFKPAWWQTFLPPVWFGAPFEMIFKGQFNVPFLIFTLLAVAIPIFAIAAYVRLIPAFEKNLSKLNQDNSKNKETKKRKFIDLPSRICTSDLELTFYRFSSIMIKKEREFKLKVYPSLGFSLIFPYIFIINQMQYMSFDEISQGKTYLYLYFGALMIPTILMMLKYSGNYKGSWIYKTIPIEKPKSIFSGTIKAFILQMLLPIFLINSIVFTGIFGFRIVPHLLAIFMNYILLILVAFTILNMNLPFTLSFSDVSKESGRTFLLMFLGGILALIHFLVTLIPYAVFAYILVLAVIIWFAWNKTLDVSWDRVESSYVE